MKMQTDPGARPPTRKLAEPADTDNNALPRPAPQAQAQQAEQDSPESIFESFAEAWERDPERWDGLE
jgi:hypothetical protein